MTDFLTMRIEDVPWGGERTRIINVLKHGAIATIADLLSRSEAELMRQPNFGKTSLGFIKQILAEHGYYVGEFKDYSRLKFPWDAEPASSRLDDLNKEIERLERRLAKLKAYRKALDAKPSSTGASQ